MTLKLARLKTWLSCEDATKYLAAILDEPVSVADILQLASEGTLRLSVYFPTPQPAELMRVVTKDAARTFPVYLPKNRGDLSEKKWKYLERLRWILENQGSQFDTMDFFALMDYLQDMRVEGRRPKDSECHYLYIGMPLSDDSVLEEIGQGIEVRGYWNLELIGGGSIELQNRYLESIGEGINDQIAWNGILLRAPDHEGNWIALKTSSPKLSLEDPDVVEMFEKFGWDSPKELQERIGVTAANKLPKDSHLVIHSEELQRFVRQLEQTKGGKIDNERQEYPPQLEYLSLAWRNNWKNADRADRSACPKKEDVKAWLMERGLSAKNADAGATIIKPQWATDKGW